MGFDKGRSHTEIYGGWVRGHKRVEVVVATSFVFFF